MEHFCQRCIGYPLSDGTYAPMLGMVTSHIENDNHHLICGKPARFREPSGFEDLEDSWYCAECWDFLQDWNRMAGVE